jgi:CRISPR/Cas system-associated endoribonuclease Cas2
VLTGATTLAKVKDLYSLNVTGVTMANVANLMSTLPIATLAVSDTSDAVGMEAFDVLVGLDDQLASVTLSDVATDAVEMSFGQYQAGTSTLAKFGGNYHLAVYDVTADSAADVGANTKVDLMHVEDSANNVALNLAELHALGSKLDNITLTADEPIQITQAQETAYRTTLDKILGGADIDIN